MKRFVALTTLYFTAALAALTSCLPAPAPAAAGWGTPGQCSPGAVAPSGEYAGLVPGDVAIPLSCRVYNASGSQCCWCSLETCARYLGVKQLYDLTEDHKRASNDREMTGVLRKRGVKFVEVRSETEIKAALAYKLPVAVFIPGHCCVCVGLDDQGARVLSNNHKNREVQKWPRSQWEQLWSGWGVVLYPPDGQVNEPQAFRQTGKLCGGGVIVQIGPRPPPVVAPYAPPVVAPYPYDYPLYAPWYAEPYYPGAYYPRPGVNIQVGPWARPYYRPHYHYHQHHRGPHGGDLSNFLDVKEVSLTAEAKHTIANCTVEVQQGHAGGSGTWIAYDQQARAGLVASAAHVFKDLGPALVTAKGMGWSRMKAKVVYLNVKTDVALLEAETDVEPVCTMLADGEPAVGSPVFKLGYPAYAQGVLNVRTGLVKPAVNGYLFESSCYVQSGDSGGGIFLGDGSLCSIITGYYGPTGHLDPTCMFGSGTEALKTAVGRLDSQGGYSWGGKLRDHRKQRRQDRRQRHQPKAAPAPPPAPRAPAPGSAVGTADRALLPWNADARHQSQRRSRPTPPADENPTLPPPKWKQPDPVAPPATLPPVLPTPPVQPPACPNPNCPCPPPCPCPPGKCPCPPVWPEAPEVSPAPVAPVNVQQTAVGLGLLAAFGVKIALLLLSRRRKAS